MSQTITTEQALYFRARRNGLISSCGSTLAQSARSLLGAQAQIETYAYQALSLRTADQPQASEVKKALHTSGELVRTWGQRDTLHLYAKEDWPLFQSASRLWVRSGRRGGMPDRGLVADIDSYFLEQGRALTRSDLFDVIPKSFWQELRNHPGSGETDEGALRFAATRLIWCLCHEGRLVFGDKVGREVCYLHRDLVWSGEWPEYEPSKASCEVVRRYFSTFGPATVQDVAHYLGARVSDTRPWIGELEKELTTVTHPERGELMMLHSDIEDLQASDDRGDWPLRLLPAYDTLLMAHKDKRWILPRAELEPKVWKKAAVVNGVVLVRGQIAGTWSFKKSRRAVDVGVESFGMDFDPSEFKVEHERLAHHLAVKPGRLELS